MELSNECTSVDRLFAFQKIDCLMSWVIDNGGDKNK